MADPSDPAETTFQRLLNREILVSERRRMLILAAMQALILVLILLAATFLPGFVRSIYHDRLPIRAALAAFSAFVAYELFAAGLLTIFIRRGRNFPVLGRYVNAFVETSFPTVLLYLLAGYLFAPASGRGPHCFIFSSSFSRRCGSILRFRPSPARSPRSRSSRSLSSRCILAGKPRSRA